MDFHLAFFFFWPLISLMDKRAEAKKASGTVLENRSRSAGHEEDLGR